MILIVHLSSCFAKASFLPVENLPELKEEMRGGTKIKYYSKFEMSKDRSAYFMYDHTVCIADENHGIIATITNKVSRNSTSEKNRLFSNMKANVKKSTVELTFDVSGYPFLGEGELKEMSDKKVVVGSAKVIYTFSKSSIKYSIESMPKVKHVMQNVFGIRINEIKNDEADFRKFLKDHKGSTIHFQRIRGKSFVINIDDDAQIFKEKKKEGKGAVAGFKTIQIKGRLGCTSITLEKPSSNGAFTVSSPSSGYSSYKAFSGSLVQNQKSQERFFTKSKKGKLGHFRLKANKKNILSGVLSFK